MNALWKHTARLRTYIVNLLSIALLALPDIIDLLAGVDWNGIIPDQYVRLFAVFLAIGNILMRPRLAVLKDDPEVQLAQLRKAGEFTGELH